MKKLQLATILSAALFGADCNGMTPEAERIICACYYNRRPIPSGNTSRILALDSVLSAARDTNSTLADSGRAVGLAVNRLADALSERGAKEGSPELLAAQANLANAHRTYINQMLRLTTLVPQRHAAQQVAPAPAEAAPQRLVAQQVAPAPVAQQRQADELRQRLIEEQNRRDDLMLQNLQPLPLPQQTGGFLGWFTNLFR